MQFVIIVGFSHYTFNERNFGRKKFVLFQRVSNASGCSAFSLHRRTSTVSMDSLAASMSPEFGVNLSLFGKVPITD